MAAAILIGMGKSSEEAIQLLISARKVADPRIWHIRRRIHAFERHWQDRGNPLRFNKPFHQIFTFELPDRRKSLGEN